MRSDLITRKNIFLEKAKLKYNNEYDYSKMNYFNNSTKVEIICSKHSSFFIEPNKHLSKYGKCKKCVKEDKLKISEKKFIENAKIIHKNKYDYSKVNYKHSKQKVSIICSKHGEFKQNPNQHLQKQGCPQCSLEKNMLNSKEYIKKVKLIHNNYYEYNIRKNIINRKKDKIEIICPDHGKFKQSARDHERGNGCRKCGDLKKRNDEEKIIKKLKEIHNGKYEYDLSDYENVYSDINIKCPDHGFFKMRLRNHLYYGYGCPSCSSSKGEECIIKYLEENNIEYIFQKKFENCIYKNPLRFDFYLPKYNICIEYDGIQHFEPIKFFGGEEIFKNIKERDNIKNEYCLENNIKLIRIPYDNINCFRNYFYVLLNNI
jgi:hypothetical protein